MAEYLLRIAGPDPVVRYVSALDDAGAVIMAKATLRDEGAPPETGVTLERRGGGMLLKDMAGRLVGKATA